MSEKLIRSDQKTSLQDAGVMGLAVFGPTASSSFCFTYYEVLRCIVLNHQTRIEVECHSYDKVAEFIVWVFPSTVTNDSRDAHVPSDDLRRK